MSLYSNKQLLEYLRIDANHYIKYEVHFDYMYLLIIYRYNCTLIHKCVFDLCNEMDINGIRMMLNFQNIINKNIINYEFMYTFYTVTHFNTFVCMYVLHNYEFFHYGVCSVCKTGFPYLS